MKTWFVYLINGKKVGTWANNNAEAERNLRKEFGNIPMEYVGMDYGEFGTSADEVICTGMSLVDVMIATGTMNALVGLRRSTTASRYVR